jgi:hypothetical protein
MSINNIPTFYDGLQYAAYETQTEYIEYLIGLNKGTTGSVGPTGPTGPSGGGTASTWIEDNLINPPPAIKYEVPIRQSTVVYIPWINYDQINAGFIGYLPLANKFEATIDHDELTSPYEINVTVSTPYNLNPVIGPSGTPFTSGLSGVVLYKTAGTNGIEYITFPLEQTPRRVYVYYNVVLDNVNYRGNTIIANYLNYYDGENNIAELDFDGYEDANGPSAVRNPTIDIPTGSTGATFSWTAPQYVDEGDTSSTLTIMEYEITYGTTGSTYRYPDPIPQVPIKIETGDSNRSYRASGLYPDSPYTYTIYAFNSADLISATGATAAPVYTSWLTPSPLGSLSFPPRYYPAPNNIYRIGGSTPITTLVNNSAQWDSSSFVAPIQNVDTRGNKDLTATMTLTANLNNSGPSVIFGGFGSTNPGPSTAVNNVTINPTSITDNYASSPNEFFEGFYQNANVTVTIGTGSFGVTGSQYNLVVTDSSSVTTQTQTFSYYYDGLSGTPTGNTNYIIGNVTQTQVSGINVMGSVGTTLETTTTINNMGTYFYRNPYLSMTSALCPTTNAVLGDIRVGYDSVGQKFTTGTIGVPKTMATNSFLTTYTNSISILSTAYNAAGSGNMTLSPTGGIPVVIDGPSYNLIRNIIPTVIPTIPSSALGCRCYSGIVPPGGTAGTPYFTYNNGGTVPYSQILYDQSWNIASTTGGTGVYDTTAEIIVANGGFSSATGPAGVSGPYKNYSVYYNNSLDYSGITTTGYRYATFVWRIAPRTTSYGILRLILNNVVSSGIVFNPLNKVASIGGLDLQVFYRFENSANLAPFNAGTPITNFTTLWANANSVAGKQFTSGTYWNEGTSAGTYNDVRYGLIGDIGTSDSSLNFNVSIPTFKITVETEYLYCRVGLPMNRQISYSSVSAVLT